MSFKLMKLVCTVIFILVIISDITSVFKFWLIVDEGLRFEVLCKAKMYMHYFHI